MTKVDILIYHSEQDNETHWVDNFKKFLQLMLIQILKKQPNIVLKSDGDQISEEDLKNVDVLIVVLSNFFIDSSQCVHTLEQCIKNINSKTSFENRVFKVLKTPIPYNKQPNKLRDQLGYDFYKVEYESGQFQEFKDYFSTKSERSYWMKLIDLAYGINGIFAVEDDSSDTSITSKFSRKSIYLAETSHDLAIQKNIIRRELLRHGHRVFPVHAMSSSLEQINRDVTTELKKCNLSIHLIGNSYGEIPEGIDRSIVDIQNRIAAEISSQTKGNSEELSRLIWISPNIHDVNEQQHSFIESIKRDASFLEGAEILEVPLEDFKNIIRNELLDSPDKKLIETIKPEDKENELKKIYLIHDKIDELAVENIKQKIEQSGYKVISPLFEGELLVLREQHISNLRDFDAVLIFKGKINDQWVKMKVLDILKAPGFGRNKPVLAKAIITTPEGIINKNNFPDSEIEIITGEEKNINAALLHFLDSIK